MLFNKQQQSTQPMLCRMAGVDGQNQATTRPRELTPLQTLFEEEGSLKRSMQELDNAIGQPASKRPCKESYRRVPCRARGLSSEHNPHTAFIDLPRDACHGMLLCCSEAMCAASGRRFRYCKVCAVPVAKRNFIKRHGHGLASSIKELKLNEHVVCGEVDSPFSANRLWGASESQPTAPIQETSPMHEIFRPNPICRSNQASPSTVVTNAAESLFDERNNDIMDEMSRHKLRTVSFDSQFERLDTKVSTQQFAGARELALMKKQTKMSRYLNQMIALSEANKDTTSQHPPFDKQLSALAYASSNNGVSTPTLQPESSLAKYPLTEASCRKVNDQVAEFASGLVESDFSTVFEDDFQQFSSN